MQGQLDIVLLAVFTAMLVSSSRGHDRLTGGLLSIALVKFQFAVPLAFVFLIRRRWRVLEGFAIGGLVFAALCLAVVGVEGLRDYVRFVRDIDVHSADTVHPQVMANLRGLAFVLLGRDLPGAVVAAAGLAVLVLMSRRGRTDVELLAAAVVATLVAAPHQNPHSLILLLPPLAVAATSLAWRTPAGLAFLLVATPVLYVPLLLLRQMGWMAIPLVAFGWLNFRSVSDGMTATSHG
jgi:hypothetical protein